MVEINRDAEVSFDFLMWRTERIQGIFLVRNLLAWLEIQLYVADLIPWNNTSEPITSATT
jgi:hypothetical protein